MSIISLCLLTLLAIVVLLLLIAFVRTFAIKASDNSQKQSKAENLSEPELNKYTEKFAEMIKIPTVSKNADEDLSDFYKFHECLEKQFPLLFKHCTKTVIDGNLVLLWKASDKINSNNNKMLPVLFMAHQDVVPASDEGWKYPAFSAHVENGIMYGRGTIDTKSSIFVQMQAVEELIAEGFSPCCDIYLAYGTNEESGGQGAPAIVEHLKASGVELAMVMDEGGGILDVAMKGMDRPYAVIGVVEKGYADLVIKCCGTGGHSSTPPRNTPLVQLGKFVAEMDKKRPFDRQLRPEVIEMFSKMAPSFGFGMRFLLGNLWLFKGLVMSLMPKVSPYGEALMQTTISFTMCHGSDAENVIPKEAYVIANIRTSVQQNLESSIAVIKKYAGKYGLEVSIKKGNEREASPCSNTKSPEYSYLSKCIADCFPEIGISPYFVMGGTDCRHYYALTKNAFRFMPICMTSEQVGKSHGINENITLSSMGKGVKFFKYFIRNLNK